MRPRWMDYLESLEAGQELTREELIEIIDGLKGANNSLFVEACERSRKDNELRQLKIKHDALEETHSRLRAELDKANALVKRHEDALDEVWEQDGGFMFFDIGCRESGLKTYGIWQFGGFGECTTLSRGCDTPLAAIEAAMKEDCNGNG